MYSFIYWWIKIVRTPWLSIFTIKTDTRVKCYVTKKAKRKHTAMATSRRCMLQIRMHQLGQPLGYFQGTPCSRQTRFRSLRPTGFQLGSNLQPKRRHINSFQSSQFLSSVLGRAQPCSTKKAEKMFRTSNRSGFWE